MARTTAAAALAVLAGFSLVAAGPALAGGLLAAGGACALILPEFVESQTPATG